MKSIGTLRAVCLALVLATAVSCGGGGGGGGAGPIGGNPNPPPPAPPPPAPPPPLGALLIQPHNYHEPVGLAFQLVEMALLTGINGAIAFDIRLGTPGTAPVIDPCPLAGTIEVRLTDRDASGGLSIGDRVVLAFVGCDDGQAIANATINIDVLGIGAVGSEQRIRLAVAIGAFSVKSGNFEFTLAGTFECEWRSTDSSDRFIVFGPEFSVTDASLTDTLRNFSLDYAQNYDAYEFHLAMAGDVASRSLGGTFTFASDVPYWGRLGNFPTAGAATFRGANNTAVRIEEGGGGEEFPTEVAAVGDFDGDGTFTHQLGSAVPWVVLTSPGFYEPLRVGIPVPPESPGIHDLRSRSVRVTPEPFTVATIGDLAVAPARQRAYVSLPERNEIVVVSTQSWQEVDRLGVGSKPGALDLSPDQGALYVALNFGGAVAAVDLGTRDVARIETATAHNVSHVHEVAASDGRLYVAPFGGPTDSYLVEVNRAGGNLVGRIGGPLVMRARAPIVTSSDGAFLYTTQPLPTGGNRLYKLDLSLPGSPVVLTRDLTTLGEDDTSRLVLSPNGQRLVLPDGQVLRTSDFAEIGRIPSARSHAYSADGAILASLRISSFAIHQADSLITLRTMPHDCPSTPESVLKHVPPGSLWVATTRDGICAIDVDNRLEPPGTAGGPALPVAPAPIALERTRYSVLNSNDALLAATIDHARGRLYAAATTPAGPQLVVVSLSTDTVLSTIALPSDTAPISVTMNDDGSRLYLGHWGSTVDRIDVFDAETLTFLQPVPYSPDLIDNPPGSGSGALSDLRWIGSNRLLLGTLGHVVTNAAVAMIDVVTGEAARIAGGQSVFFGDARFAVTPDLSAVIVGARPPLTGSQRLIRIDLELPDPDVDNERDHPELAGASNVVLSADGEIVYIGGGAAVDARTLMLEGRMVEGVPVPTPDLSLVHVLGRTGLSLHSFDAATYQLRAIYDLAPCGNSLINFASLAPDGRALTFIQDSFVCRVTLPAGP